MKSVLLIVLIFCSISIYSQVNDNINCKPNPNQYILGNGKTKVARRNLDGFKQDSLFKERLTSLDLDAKKIREDYLVVIILIINHKGKPASLKFNANLSNIFDDKIIRRFEKLLSSIQFEQLPYEKVFDYFTFDGKKSIENLYYRN